jgi:excisionase family DNA binding protein
VNTQTKLAVSLREAAAMLSVSPRTLQNFIFSKRLRARKIGRRTVVRLRDLETFLDRDQPPPLITKVETQRGFAARVNAGM